MARLTFAMKFRTAVALSTMLFVGLPLASQAQSADHPVKMVKQFQTLAAQGAARAIRHEETTLTAAALRADLARLLAMAKQCGKSQPGCRGLPLIETLLGRPLSLGCMIVLMTIVGEILVVSVCYPIRQSR